MYNGARHFQQPFCFLIHSIVDCDRSVIRYVDFYMEQARIKTLFSAGFYIGRRISGNPLFLHMHSAN
jgi:hypothetical protein